MTPPIYLPTDEFGGRHPPDLDLAADYLELSAATSAEGRSYSVGIVDALEMAADSDFESVEEEIENRESVANGALARIATRQRLLRDAYPFAVDNSGSTVSFLADGSSLGQAAYLVSLLLSNLRSVTPLLGESDLHPSDDETRDLRRYFQYFATAALAAEVGGQSWSFGFPRPDGTGFIEKLSEIWSVLKDGAVSPDRSAPLSPKDDQVDVFAWREQRDGLPGFLLAVAQVATGSDWRQKSIKAHVRSVFPSRWFNPSPVTDMVAYHLVPFARADDRFRDDVRILGNVLHRIRLPARVCEAVSLKAHGLSVEAFDELYVAAEWIEGYFEQVRNRH